MKTEIITFAIFCLTFLIVGIICKTIDFIENRIACHREEQGYIKYLENENMKLRKNNDFLKLQYQLAEQNGKATDMRSL